MSSLLLVFLYCMVLQTNFILYGFTNKITNESAVILLNNKGSKNIQSSLITQIFLKTHSFFFLPFIIKLQFYLL